MTLFVRKVRQGRWDLACDDTTKPLPADPMHDLRTDDDALSVWVLGPGDASLEDVVIALATGGTTLSNVDVIIVPEDSVAALSLSIDQDAEGDTPLVDTNRSHRDIVKLTAADLVRIGEVLRTGERRRFSERQVRALVSEAINERRIDPYELSDGIQAGLRRRKLIP